QRDLAETRALPRLRHEVGDKLLFPATAVFWDQGEYVAAAVDWDEVIDGGASLLEMELEENQDAQLRDLQDSMSPEEIDFCQVLFERKVSSPSAVVHVSPADTQWLMSTFQDPKAFAIQRARELAELQGNKIELGWLDAVDSGEEAQKALDTARKLFSGVGIV